ncbi:DUF6282 family protein [Falsiroseomonas oryzae]|uniref:DUF6282 family protein n=1 Tax=Falsiroseomonas oryzae TaxID=2766473 RepID=UPI0022EB88D0|nr:DUF6282 family protein [Roseomonas sp. MO-31]
MSDPAQRPAPATTDVRRLPFAELLDGAVDSHVHCGPHINPRTVTVFDAVRDAAAAGLVGLGVMDVFANTSGLAALAMRELGHLGVEVFGGIILEPYVGGVDPRTVRMALGMGYGPGSGARFVSLPCHATRFVAEAERRPADFVARCFAWDRGTPIPEPLPEILDLIAAADAVFNTGHVTGDEALRLVTEARRRGVRHILCPAAYFTPEDCGAIAEQGAFVEFAFFVLSHATAIGQTMSDEQKHRFAPVTLEHVAACIRAAGPGRTVLSSDSGSYVLPPPVEAFREMLVMIHSCGFTEAELRTMSARNPAQLFLRGRHG